MLVSLKSQNLATVIEFDCPEGDRDSLITSQLRPFLNTPFNLLHFACHCFSGPEGEPEDKACLVLNNGFRLYFYDFRLARLRLKNSPLVFLNACETDMQDPAQTCNTVRSLLMYGARGAIVTESRVPDVFAAEYAGEFYKRFLNGHTLGYAALMSRKYLLRRYRNPLGLFYAIYADGNTKFHTLP